MECVSDQTSDLASAIGAIFMLQFTANLLIIKLRVSSSIIQIQFGGIPLRGGTKQFEN